MSARPRGVRLRKGARVTQELPRYFDGTPSARWPNPQYLGTVLRLDSWHGCEYARVKFDSGRPLEWVNVDRLFVVTP